MTSILKRNAMSRCHSDLAGTGRFKNLRGVQEE